MAQSNELPGVVFRTKSGNIVDFNDIQDEIHYSWTCRCGCGSTVAGYGKDIKSAARIHSQPTVNSGEVATRENAARLEFSMKIRPYVSDRFIQKSIFKLTDDEIDAMAAQRAKEGKVDPVIEHGGAAEGHEPVQVGTTAYSKVTREGPFTVADFTMADIKVGEGETAMLHKTYCGVLRTESGRYITVPVADLVSKLPELPKVVGPHDHLSPRARAKAKRQIRYRRATKKIAMLAGVMLLGWSCLVTSVLIYLSIVWG